MQNICNALREAPGGNHEYRLTVVACFAAWLKTPSAMSEKCTSVCVDLLDEITGQIEQDLIDQQAETAWTEKEDMPGFAGTYANLGALTLYGSAA